MTTNAPTIYDDGTYLSTNPDWHSQDSDWKAQQLMSLFDSRILSALRRSGTTIAEIGCGYGGVLAAAKEWLGTQCIRCEATGYDISKIACAEASRRHADIRIVCGEFPAAHETYDLIILADVLEHVAGPGQLLRSASKRCRFLLLHIPLEANLYVRLLHGADYRSWLRHDRGHIHLFTKDSAIRLICSARAKILSWKYTTWGLDLYLPGTGRSAPVVRFLRSVGMPCCPDVTVRVLGGASLGCLCKTERRTRGPLQ